MSRRDELQHNTPTDPSDFERRLKAKLDARREKEAVQYKPKGWAVGMRYGSEFMAGVIIGIMLGFLVDWILNIAPWGMLSGAMLGFAAGTINVVRAAKEVNAAGDGRTESRQDPRK